MIIVKNIVFDMGGVLLNFNLEKTVKEYFPEEDVDLLKEKVFMNHYWRDMDGGYIQFDEAITRILPDIPSKYHSKVTEMLTDFYPYMPLYEEMYDFIKRIKNAGYRVYLLSNATPRVFDHYFDIPAFSLMDGLFVSSLYKMLKPSPDIYNKFCEQFKLRAEECFFIDDVAENINGAKSIGMKGYILLPHNLSDLEKALNEENVIF